MLDGWRQHTSHESLWLTTILKQPICHNYRANRVNLNIRWKVLCQTYCSFEVAFLFCAQHLSNSQPNRVACDNHTWLLSWTRPYTSTQTSTKSLFITIEYVFLHTLFGEIRSWTGAVIVADFFFRFCLANINSGFNTRTEKPFSFHMRFHFWRTLCHKWKLP